MANMGTIPYPIEQLVFAQEMVKLQQVTPGTSWKCFDLSSIQKQLESFVLLTTPLRAEPQYYLKKKLTSHMTLSRSLFPSQESSNFTKSGHCVVKRTEFGNVISVRFAAHTTNSAIGFSSDIYATLTKHIEMPGLDQVYPAWPLPRGLWAKSWSCLQTAFWLVQRLISWMCPQQSYFLKASDNFKNIWHIWK